MTNTELLFREYRRDKAISYEEFKKAGWEEEDYLEYINLCEQIRAFCVCEKNLTHISGVKEHIIYDVKKKGFQELVSRLSKFLSRFFDRSLDLGFQSGALIYWVYVHGGESERDKEEIFARKILTNMDVFRYRIEIIINSNLIHDLGRIIGDDLDETSSETLQEEILKGEEALITNEKPEMPDKLDDYAELQAWAEEYDTYCYIEDIYEFDIETMKEALVERLEFDVKNDILYVYVNSPICVKEHDVIGKTANIRGLDGENIQINVHYCVDCKRFFITQDEYDMYIEEYEFLPVRFKKIEQNSYDYVYGDRSKYSPLFLCGYTVSKQKGLSEETRQTLLARLIDDGVFSKARIIEYLRYFIDTNGEKPSNRYAREKWRRDMFFVMEYEKPKQDEVNIDEIISASNKLKIKD